MEIDEIIKLFLKNIQDYNDGYLKPEEMQHIQKEIVITVKKVNEALNNQSIIAFSPYVMLLLAGLKGNLSTTNVLMNCEIADILDLLSSKILSLGEFENLSQFLLMKQKNKNLICADLLEIIIHYFKEVPLSKGFFYRDAAIWIIFQLEYPHMTDYTGIVLPLALNIADSCVNVISIAGFRALSHIAIHSYKAHLRYYGHSDIIYDTLKKKMNTQDTVILDVVIPCLLTFIQIFDVPPSQSLSLSTESRYKHSYDEVSRLILHDLYFVSNSRRKQVLLFHLDSLTDLLGTSIMKHVYMYIKVMHTVLLSPESVSSIDSSKSILLKNIVKVLPSLKFILKYIIADFVKILFAYMDETVHTEDILVSKIFDIICLHCRREVLSIYEGMEDVLVHKDKFHFLKQYIYK